jgi:hypothetical protein
MPSMRRLPIPKAVVIPKVKPATVVLPPVLTPQQSLRQFATKPVVKPLNPGAIKKITKPLKSYL